jgi:hypothetical protein
VSNLYCTDTFQIIENIPLNARESIPFFSPHRSQFIPFNQCVTKINKHGAEPDMDTELDPDAEPYEVPDAEKYAVPEAEPDLNTEPNPDAQPYEVPDAAPRNTALLT